MNLGKFSFFLLTFNLNRRFQYSIILHHSHRINPSLISGG
jgi:hypothetical protein